MGYKYGYLRKGQFVNTPSVAPILSRKNYGPTYFKWKHSVLNKLLQPRAFLGIFNKRSRSLMDRTLACGAGNVSSILTGSTSVKKTCLQVFSLC